MRSLSGSPKYLLWEHLKIKHTAVGWKGKKGHYFSNRVVTLYPQSHAYYAHGKWKVAVAYISISPPLSLTQRRLGCVNEIDTSMQSMFPFWGKHANQCAYICMFIHARRDYGSDMQIVTSEVLSLHALHHPTNTNKQTSAISVEGIYDLCYK